MKSLDQQSQLQKVLSPPSRGAWIEIGENERKVRRW